jgi:hypothetical protein
VGLVVGELLWGLGFLTEEWSWRWVDRASWAVTIIGLPLVVYQVAVLRREQARKPKIVFGVAKSEGEVEPLRSSVDVDRGIGSIAIQMPVKNVGNLTARGLLFNYQLPEDSPIASIEPLTGSGEFIPKVRLWQIKHERLHPQSIAISSATIVLISGFELGAVRIDATATMDDFDKATGTITLQVGPTATRGLRERGGRAD